MRVEISYDSATSPDCNANGLLDSCEIAAGYATDADGNGIPDRCEDAVLPCPLDFDGNDAVDGADLGLMLAAWGSTTDARMDLNDDGTIDGADLGLLLAGWGGCAR